MEGPADRRGDGGATGPASEVAGPVGTGRFAPPASPVPVDLEAHGYVEEEFFVSGEAEAYEGNGALLLDGRWEVRPVGSAPYRTRIVVRRPADPARGSGTVLVEWLNVSAGLEACPDWAYLHTEIIRSGCTYVAVSAQALGVEGGEGLLGASLDGGLRHSQPERYDTLHHPGDRYSFDMFTQIGRALRHGGPVDPLGGMRPHHVLAVGESQAAFFLTTYVNAVQPTSRAYDGFFVHSRSGTAASLESQAFGPGLSGLKIREDVGVPVVVFETETDMVLLDYGAAEQPDSAWVRVWEVAGTAHADAYLVGSTAAFLGCDFAVNDGPMHWVAVAAFAGLVRWVDGGPPLPAAPRLAFATRKPPVLATDELGNALGGLRTPAVDVPVAVLSGLAPAGVSRMCQLFGQTTPFDEATLVRLYRDRAGYLTGYERSLDEAIERGYLLVADRPELMARAEQVPFPS